MGPSGDPKPGHRIDEELELVCLQRAQAETLFALIQTHRAYLSHWLSWPQEIQSLEDTQSFIRYSLQQFVAGEFIIGGKQHQRFAFAGVGFH